MSTPLHIVLALTKEGADLYEVSCRDGTGSRFGVGGSQVEALIRELVKHGFVPGRPEVVVLPKEGLNRERKQYRTRYLLGLARDRARTISDWHTKVLVITDADTYSTGSLFVVGQAEVDGRAAMVSVARIGSGDEDRFMRRLLKEALHELGHTLGLGHCRDKGCVMFRSRILPDSDVKSDRYCKRCRIKVGRSLDTGP